MRTLAEAAAHRAYAGASVQPPEPNAERNAAWREDEARRADGWRPYEHAGLPLRVRDRENGFW